MKQRLILCLVMMVIATTLNAAGVGNGIKVQALENRKIQVTVPGTANGTELSLSDASGKTLFSVSVASEVYEKVIDLKNLPMGSYILSADNGEKLEMITIELVGKALALGVLETKFRPTMTLKEETVYVNIPSNLGKVDISVIDDEDHVLCHKTVDSSKAKGQVLDFSQSPKSNYTIWVSSTDFETSQSIDLND